MDVGERLALGSFVFANQPFLHFQLKQCQERAGLANQYRGPEGVDRSIEDSESLSQRSRPRIL